MIKVLIVDDCATARLALRHALESDSELHVVGAAATGAEALQLIQRYDPDIVTMDVYLEQEDGIDVTASIMSSTPRPILIVTGANARDPALTYRAVEAGALEVTAKLNGPKHPDYERQRGQLVRLTKTLSSIPVVHHFRRSASTPASTPPASVSSKAPASRQRDPAPRVVLMGASTGGPATIANILRLLPAPFSLPVVVVQHISPGFADGFTQWLAATTGHRTVTVDAPMQLRSGRVYLARDGTQLTFTARDYLGPARASPNAHYTPSFDELLLSAAEVRANAVSVILTGMGADGTRGLAALRPRGGVAIAQTPTSCVVTGMPQSAISARLVDYVLDPGQIVDLLSGLG